MPAISWEPLPAAIGVAVLSLAAVSQAVARRVPNVLTLPAILTGWLFAAHIDASRQAAWPGHTFLASLTGTFVALAIMLPVYRSRRLRAGCVKAQMAFAAWSCCAIPLVPALAITACAAMSGLVVTFALAHLTLADLPNEKRRNYEFPAQITMTIVAVVGALASWMIVHST